MILALLKTDLPALNTEHLRKGLDASNNVVNYFLVQLMGRLRER